MTYHDHENGRPPEEIITDSKEAPDEIIESEDDVKANNGAASPDGVDGLLPGADKGDEKTKKKLFLQHPTYILQHIISNLQDCYHAIYLRPPMSTKLILLLMAIPDGLLPCHSKLQAAPSL